MSEKKKYELTDETKVVTDEGGQEHTLHRICALKEFYDVSAGDLGGWVESEGKRRSNRRSRSHTNPPITTKRYPAAIGGELKEPALRVPKKMQKAHFLSTSSPTG